MPDLIVKYITGASMARLGILLFVLIADFVFRRFVYGRSDPLSFSLLNFSFLLVVSDSFLKIVEVASPSNVRSPLPVLIPALVYLALFFVVYLLALLAHQGYKSAQEENINAYLDKILPQDTPAGVRDVLQKLSATMIEPDAFEKNPNKERKRIEYLKAVARLANVQIDYQQDQRMLLAGKGQGRFLAQLAYVSSCLFSLTTTLYFFSVR